MSGIYDVMIIGGGASGLIAACTLARRGRRVVLLEKLKEAKITERTVGFR